MKALAKQLAGDFVVMDLGSANSAGLLESQREIASAMTLIEIDARASDPQHGLHFYRTVHLRKAIAGKAGSRVFKTRRFPEGSSFLDPRPEALKAYGLEQYFELVRTEEIVCDSLSSVLSGENLQRIDFLKTDLEGLDFEVLNSAPELIRQTLCLQSELRFEPFFIGEPSFHHTVAYLAELGFDLVWLQPHVWKFATPQRRFAREGRLVWADSVFFLKPACVAERFPVGTWKAFAKQIILAKVLGLHNFCQRLFFDTEQLYTTEIRAELRWFSRLDPPFSWRIADAVRRLPFGWQILGGCRRLFAQLYTATAIFKDDVVGILPPK